MSEEVRLLDSSIWISIRRRQANRALIERVATLTAGEQVLCNEIVKLEVLVGSRDKQEFARNEFEFIAVEMCPITARTWSIAADLGYSLRRRGVSPSVPDTIIAASAIEHEAVLMHADRDFDLIATHSDLRVESYVDIAI